MVYQLSQKVEKELERIKHAAAASRIAAIEVVPMPLSRIFPPKKSDLGHAVHVIVGLGTNEVCECKLCQMRYATVGA